MKRIIKAASLLLRGALLLSLAFVMAGACVMELAPDNPDDWLEGDRALHAQINAAFMVAALSALFILLIEKIRSKQP